MAIRLAFRTLLRSRWYALTAIGTITLTIALGATVFAVVDGVLFKPLPYPDSHRLFTLVGSAAPPWPGWRLGCSGRGGPCAW